MYYCTNNSNSKQIINNHYIIILKHMFVYKFNNLNCFAHVRGLRTISSFPTDENSEFISPGNRNDMIL